MIPEKENTDDICRCNTLALLNSDPSVSMYRLSMHMHACENYTRRILTEKINPSLGHISSVSSCFRLKDWELVYPVKDINPELLADIQMLNRLPASLLPHLWDYAAFLLSQEN